MNRRPAGPLSPRPARRSGGLLARSTGQLTLVGGGAVVLVLLVVAVIVLLGRCGKSAQAYDCGAKAPAPPNNFSYASKYCAVQQHVGQRAQFQSVPLTDRSSPRSLALYSYDGGTWRRLGTMDVSSDGSYATSSTTFDLPKSFAVLRRNTADFQVFGTLPRGGQPSADAGKLITVEVPAVYSPAADGSIAGGAVTVAAAPRTDFDIMPAIVAESPADAQTVTTLLGDDSRRAGHVDRIVAEAERGAWKGVEIDYTTVDPGLKANFTSFVQALATKLHAAQRKLVLRLPLPRHEVSSWNVGAYDWPSLAKSADYFVLMAERDQSIYRTRVPDAVKYLVTQVVDSRKLVLEISPLSEEKSETGAVRTLTTLEALSIAGQVTVRDPDNVFTDSDVVVSADNINRDGGSGLQWSTQGALSFVYTAGQEQRTVWIEDQFSAGYKLEIVQLYRLGGVAVDNATGDQALANIWPAIDQYNTTSQPALQQPNPQTLRPTWLADNQPIPDAGSRAVITWHTPTTPGRHALTVVLGDGTMRVAETANVDVKALPPGGVRPTPAAGVGGPSPRATASPTRTSNIAPTRAPSTTAR